jgi:uncharacterized phage protein (TIGR01671 family)
MREILFRGKRVENGEWVFGDLSQHKSGKRFIKRLNASALCSYEVIPETLGQFTGGYGRNTTNYAYTKLWENDIVKIFSDADGYFNGIKRYIYGVITYDEDSLDWKINLDHIRYGREEFLCNFTDNIEVVGNRFDNPELLTAD